MKNYEIIGIVLAVCGLADFFLAPRLITFMNARSVPADQQKSNDELKATRERIATIIKIVAAGLMIAGVLVYRGVFASYFTGE